MDAPPNDPFLDQLNEQQREAVVHGDGPQLVLAGAGSGKTRVITYRVAWLIHRMGIDPHSVVAVTFTNKAAGEMRERIEGLVAIHPLTSFVGTFHRLSLDLLRRYGRRVGVRPGFSILDRADQIVLVKKALEAEQLSESSFPPKPILSAISSAKNKMVDVASYEQEARGFFRGAGGTCLPRLPVDVGAGQRCRFRRHAGLRRTAPDREFRRQAAAT